MILRVHARMSKTSRVHHIMGSALPLYVSFASCIKWSIFEKLLGIETATNYTQKTK